MFWRALVTIASLCAASAASAACSGPGTALFTCTFKGGKKQVNVCLQGNVVLYSFGATGRAPELLLGRDVTQVGFTPWSGVGRSIWEELTLSSGDFAYALSYSIDRAPDGDLPSGQLMVGRGGRTLANLNCDVGSVDIHDFYPLFEAKEAAGQRFCIDTQSWGAGC